MPRLVVLLVLALVCTVGCRRKVTAVADAAPTLPLDSLQGAPTAALPGQTAPIAPLSPNARTEDERNTIAIFREVAPSTVFVTQSKMRVDIFGTPVDEVQSGSGTGFVWDTAGHIVTNFHVVQGASSVMVTFSNQQERAAQFVAAEPKKDIAVLKVDAPAQWLKPVRVPQNLGLEVGQKTLAIGNPFGLDHTLTTGVISALGRQVQGFGNVSIRDVIQTDAAINPGNSGGPLLDSAGQLIGMNAQIFSKTGSSVGIGFAIPVSTIARVVPQLIKNKKVETPGLAINIDLEGRYERRLGIRGVIIVGVQPNGPAARAGLRGLQRTAQGLALGDVIVAIDGRKVENYDDYYNSMDLRRAGDKIEVTVQRGDQRVKVVVEAVAL